MCYDSKVTWMYVFANSNAAALHIMHIMCAMNVALQCVISSDLACSHAGSSAWNSNEAVLLPVFAFEHSSPKDFWLGVCMLLKVLDHKCIQDRLLTSTSDHKCLVDKVIQVLQTQMTENCEEDVTRTAVFWPALEILAILLDRLGYRFWNFTSALPEELFLVIVKTGLFQFELQRGQSNSEVSTSVVLQSKEALDPAGDELLSLSQMVYGWDSNDCHPDNPEAAYQERSSTKVHTAFSWLCPFVNSLLEFGQAAEKPAALSLNLASRILGQETSVGNESVSVPGLNKPMTFELLKECLTYDQCLLFLSQLVHLLFAHERYLLLLNTKESWLALISSAMVLFCNSSKTHRAPRRSFMFSVSSASPVPVLPTSLTSVSKVTLEILKSSAGRRVPGAVSIVNLINQHTNNTPLQLRSRRGLGGPATSSLLDVSGISAVLVQVLDACLFSQDLEGPYLPFERGEPTRPASNLLVSVKREHHSNLSPVVSIKREPFDPTITIKQEGGSDLYPTVQIRRHFKQEKDDCCVPESSKTCTNFGLDLDDDVSDDCVQLQTDSSDEELPSFTEQMQFLLSNRKRAKSRTVPTRSVKHQPSKTVQRRRSKTTNSIEPIVISSDSDTEPSLPVSLGIDIHKSNVTHSSNSEALPVSLGISLRRTGSKDIQVKTENVSHSSGEDCTVRVDLPVLVQKADSTTTPSSSSPEGIGPISVGGESGSMAPEVPRREPLDEDDVEQRMDTNELSSNECVLPDTSFVYEDFSSQVLVDEPSDDEGYGNAVALAAREVTHPCHLEVLSLSDDDGAVPAFHKPAKVQIYHRRFKVPSLVVEGRTVSSQSSLKIRPCRLVLSKVSGTTSTGEYHSQGSLGDSWSAERVGTLVVSIPCDLLQQYASQNKPAGTLQEGNGKNDGSFDRGTCVPMEVDLLNEPQSHQSQNTLFPGEDLFTSSQVYLDHEEVLMEQEDRNASRQVQVLSAGGLLGDRPVNSPPAKVGTLLARPPVGGNEAPGCGREVSEQTPQGLPYRNESRLPKPPTTCSKPPATPSGISCVQPPLPPSMPTVLPPAIPTALMATATRPPPLPPLPAAIFSVPSAFRPPPPPPPLPDVFSVPSSITPPPPPPSTCPVTPFDSIPTTRPATPPDDILPPLPPTSPVTPPPPPPSTSPVTPPEDIPLPPLPPATSPVTPPDDLLPSPPPPCPVTNSDDVPLPMSPGTLLDSMPLPPLPATCSVLSTSKSRFNCLPPTVLTSGNSANVPNQPAPKPLAPPITSSRQSLAQSPMFTSQAIPAQKKEFFYLKFLSWHPAWFMVDDYCPQGLLNAVPQGIPDVFGSFMQYFQVFEPLILLELWGTVSLSLQLELRVFPSLLVKCILLVLVADSRADEARKTHDSRSLVGSYELVRFPDAIVPGEMQKFDNVPAAEGFFLPRRRIPSRRRLECSGSVLGFSGIGDELCHGGARHHSPCQRQLQPRGASSGSLFGRQPCQPVFQFET